MTGLGKFSIRLVSAGRAARTPARRSCSRRTLAQTRDVGAGAERALAGAGQNDGANLVIVLGDVEDLEQLIDQRVSSALSLSGRFSVISAALPRCSTRTGSTSGRPTISAKK